MDFSNLLTKALPWIGAAATGNVPALITLAANEVGSALGVDVAATADAIGSAVAHATPEQLLALKDRELGFQERMQAMGFTHVEDMARLAVEEAKVFVADTADARHANSGDTKVYWLGISVLGTFAILMVLVLLGCYRFVIGEAKMDMGAVAVVAGLIGTVVGYAAANAQQVVSYFFGSSKGSKDNGQRLGDALSETMKHIGNKG
nr:hypothetical protein [uncultured Albidiferax sp.]